MQEKQQQESASSKEAVNMVDTAENVGQSQPPAAAAADSEPVKTRRWWHGFKEPGHALQIITAAVLAIAIGMAVTTTVDEVPEAARVILAIPGTLWLRALKAVGRHLSPFTASPDSAKEC